MIGIIGAMEIEVAALKKMMENGETAKISGVEFTKGKILGKDVVVATCGIGKVFAAICTEAMILNYKPDIIINTGVGGTLTNKLNIGDIAVGEAVVQHDMDTSPIGDPVGFLSGIKMIEIPCDKNLGKLFTEACREENINTVSGVIATGDQFIATKEQKERITATFDNTIACEMEGGSIGHTAYVNNVPFLVVRAISDNADGGAPSDFGAFVRTSTENNIKVLTKVIGKF